MTRTATITTADQLLIAGESIGRCELAKGVLKTMSPAGGRHGKITMRLAVRLAQFAEARQLGECYAAETGFLLERNPDTVRAADIAFIQTSRLAEADTIKFIPIAPDLVVETLSPEDRASAVAQKVQWWLDHGVQQVWVVDGDSETVVVHTRSGRPQSLSKADTLAGGEALSGFELKLSELFS